MLKVVAGVLIRPPTCHALLPNVPDWIISCGVSARAVILGILSACLLCLATITNNHLIHQTHLVGHQMPVFVFGMLILFVALINPLLARFGANAAFSGKELAVVLALTMAACVVPQSGFMRYFTPAVMTPHHYERTEPGWKSSGVVDMLPDRMLPKVTEEDREEVVGGFVKGLKRPLDQTHIRVSDVPWSSWVYTMAFWAPLLICLWFGLIGLSMVLHRQWSTHEQLAYPIAMVAGALLPEGREKQGGVFRQRLFVVGVCGVLVVHLVNYLHAWFPEETLYLPRRYDLRVLLELFPTLQKGPNFHLFRPDIYFCVIAFAFFLSPDVSLSLGVGPFIYCFVAGTLATYGLSLGGGWMAPNLHVFLQFGAFMSMFLGVVVMGRHYYVRVFRRAIGMKVREEPEGFAVWGARVFLVAMAGFIGVLSAIGLDWQIALLYAVLLVVLYVVLSRVVAETGFFHPESGWLPCVIMMGLFGPKALNPDTYIVVLLLSLVLAINPRESLMPYIINALKILDLRRLQVGSAARWCMVSLVIALVGSLALTLYIEYDKGMNIGDSGVVMSVVKAPMRGTIHFQQRLEALDLLEEARSIEGWDRFLNIRPHRWAYLVAFGVGVALVGSFTLLRLRFARWPLHPVMFITWTTSMGRMMAVSFLIGWFLKVLITRYGGAGAYQRYKPLMIGLIAGDLVGSVVPFLLGAFLRIVTDWRIVGFNVMPG